LIFNNKIPLKRAANVRLSMSMRISSEKLQTVYFTIDFEQKCHLIPKMYTDYFGSLQISVGYVEETKR